MFRLALIARAAVPTIFGWRFENIWSPSGPYTIGSFFHDNLRSGGLVVCRRFGRTSAVDETRPPRISCMFQCPRRHFFVCIHVCTHLGRVQRDCSWLPATTTCVRVFSEFYSSCFLCWSWSLQCAKLLVTPWRFGQVYF